MRPKASWAGLICCTYQHYRRQSGQIPDEPQQRIDGYGRKDFQKRKVLRRQWKTPCEMSTTGPGPQLDDGEELGDDDAPDGLVYLFTAL